MCFIHTGNGVDNTRIFLSMAEQCLPVSLKVFTASHTTYQHKKLGGDTAGTQLTLIWPKRCFISYNVILSNKSRGKKEEGGSFRLVVPLGETKLEFPFLVCRKAYNSHWWWHQDLNHDNSKMHCHADFLNWKSNKNSSEIKFKDVKYQYWDINCLICLSLLNAPNKFCCTNTFYWFLEFIDVKNFFP